MNEFIKSLENFLVGEYSISRRIKQEVFDSFPHDYIGIRIIFEKDECLQESFEQIISGMQCKRIKDYREKPWDDGYQSIHIDMEVDTVPVEIQLRTVVMDRNAQKLILEKGNHYWHKKS